MGVLSCPDLGSPAKSLGNPWCFIVVWCHAISGDCGSFPVEVAWVNGGGADPRMTRLQVVGRVCFSVAMRLEGALPSASTDAN